MDDECEGESEHEYEDMDMDMAMDMGMDMDEAEHEHEDELVEGDEDEDVSTTHIPTGCISSLILVQNGDNLLCQSSQGLTRFTIHGWSVQKASTLNSSILCPSLACTVNQSPFV